MIAIHHRLRGVALLAAVLTTALGAGCSGQKSSEKLPSGDAKVGVTLNALQATQIQRMTLTVADGGSAPTFTAITTNLTNNDPVNSLTWQAFVSGIPAGTARRFTVQAFDGTNTVIYQGFALSDVTSGGTASVSIILQGNNDGGFQNQLPQIVALSASASTVTVGTTPPPSPVTLYFHATDTDPGASLTYSWASSCGGTPFDTATGNVDQTNGNTVHWTAPTSAPPSACTLSLVVADSRGGAVHAALTVQLRTSTTGSANVVAYANSWPMINSLAANETFTKNGAGQVVSVDYDLVASATDSDGDYVNYAWSASGCTLAAGDGFTPSAVYGPGALASSAVHLKTTDLLNACVITLHVTDYWAPGKNPTGIPAGSAKGGDTVASIFGSAQQDFAIAPAITFHSAPNAPQNATDVSASFTVAANQAVPLTVNVQDGQPSFAQAGGPFTFDWVQSGGTTTTAALSAHMEAYNTTSVATSSVVWTSDTAYQPNSYVRVTVTSVQGQKSTYTWNFLPANPCNAGNDGASCDTGLGLCAPNGHCSAGACVSATPVSCAAPTQCETANTCNPSTGTCQASYQPSGWSCNDNNGCTTGETCNGSGTCGGAVAVTCAAANQCQVAGSEACVSTGDLTHSCSYVNLASGTSCNADSSGCTPNDTCNGSGVCVADAPVVCAQSTNSCQAATGSCQSLTNTTHACNYAAINEGGSCSSAGLCITGQTCVTGTCAGGSNKCPSENCDPGTGVCTPTVVAPQFSRDYQVSAPAALAMDTVGNTYMAAGLVGGPFTFNGHTLTSSGDSDIFLAKTGTNGLAQWAVALGDSAANAQVATGVAVTQNGTVAVIGNFSGTFSIGSGSLSSAAQIDFLAGFSATDGSGQWASQFDDGSNGALKAVAANPNHASNRIAACGYASGGTPSNFVGGSATAAAGKDIILGAWSSTGSRLWAIQLNSSVTYNDECDAVAVDDNGDVWAAGYFSGASLNFGGATSALTGPANSNRKFLWVAKFNGATGAAISSTVFSGTLGNAVPFSLVATSTEVVVGGQFTSNVTIGSTLTSAGAGDAFVAMLAPSSLAPVWAVRLGGGGSDVANGVAVDSYGDVIATGLFFGTATMTGTATTVATPGAASNPFVLKLNGGTGAVEDVKSFSDAATATGDAIAVNRFGANQISLAGTLNATMTVPAPAGNVSATNVTDVYLIPAILQ
jgi:hypothetical protein